MKKTAAIKSKPRPTLEFERAYRARGLRTVGVDEVGRGCLAGPVVTAAVSLPDFILDAPADLETPVFRKGDELDERSAWWLLINDSKLVPAPLRERLAKLLWKCADVQVAWCMVEEIDQWNILHASMVAMRRAVSPFSGLAQVVLVDGHLSPYETRFRCPPHERERLGFTHVETLVKGDQRSLSIAAASIVAKVYRDQWMAELDQLFPGYAFGEHKGYSTPLHYQAIEKLGACALHRRSFAPFKVVD